MYCIKLNYIILYFIVLFYNPLTPSNSTLLIFPLDILPQKCNSFKGARKGHFILIKSFILSTFFNAKFSIQQYLFIVLNCCV